MNRKRWIEVRFSANDLSYEFQSKHLRIAGHNFCCLLIPPSESKKEIEWHEKINFLNILKIIFERICRPTIRLSVKQKQAWKASSTQKTLQRVKRESKKFYRFWKLSYDDKPFSISSSSSRTIAFVDVWQEKGLKFTLLVVLIDTLKWRFLTRLTSYTSAEASTRRQNSELTREFGCAYSTLSDIALNFSFTSNTRNGDVCFQ